MAAVVVFLFLVFSCRLPAAPVLGRVQLRQARHLVLVVAALERLAVFLAGCALHPQVLHHLAELPVDEIPMADLREVVFVHLRPWAVVYRIADAQVHARDFAAESVPTHLALHSALRLGVASAVDHVLVETVVHARKLTAAANSPLPLDDLPHPARETARPVCRGPGHARTVRAKDPHAVPLQAVLSPGDLDRPVCLLRTVAAKRVPRPVLSHLARRVQLCLAGAAVPLPDHQPHRPDL